MESALAAYRKLVAMAAADGEIDDRERALLERYRESLGVPPDLVPLPTGRVPPVEVSQELLACPTAERAQVVRMMARVAFADGVMLPRERRRLFDLAEAMGVGRLQLTSILVETEQHARRVSQGRLERRLLGLAVAGMGALSLFLVLRDGGVPAQGADSSAALSLQDPTARFAELERELSASTLLVRTVFNLTREGKRRRFGSYGTAFFVTPDGLAATCKHVLQPWKWRPEAAALMEKGWELEESALRVEAWPAGGGLRDAAGELDHDQAWDSSAGTLALAGMPPDQMERRSVSLGGGRRWEGLLHANDDSDLALLRVRVASPVRAFELLPPGAEVAKLDHVLVLGYPQGADPVEGRRLDTSPSAGRVRKIQETIQVDAGIVTGNSGGPVLDLGGRVIGVAARTIGDSSMGECIDRRHLLALLPAAEELVELAERYLGEGEPEAARQSLALACLRSPSAATARRIAELSD